MIKNERQYKITKTQADRFRDALSALGPVPEDSKSPRLARAQREAIHSQLIELEEQISEYETLKSGSKRTFEIQHFEDLAKALIQARIASGLTQDGLAQRLKLHAQQVQQYESTDYANASFARLNEIANALGIVISNNVILPTDMTGDGLLRKLRGLGFERKFIERRLVPSGVGDRLAFTTDRSEVSRSAHFAARVLDLDIATLLTEEAPALDFRPLAAVRHKLSKRSDAQKVSVYTVYAHYVALLALNATRTMKQRVAPEDTDELHDAIRNSYGGELSFSSALRYAWEHLGIPVVPLRLHGGFHGATWRIKGLNVIVLNPSQRYPAFWLNDLLHEIGHTAQEPDQEERSIIEIEPTWDDRDDSDDERDARVYAIDTIFRSRGDELAAQCEGIAGSVEGLKRAVERVAKQQNVPLDSLALHMAARLPGQTWWGPAMKLQPQGVDAFEFAKAEFLKWVNLSALCREDRELLLLAIQGDSE